MLWSKSVLGDSNPTSLNYSVFYFVSQSFGTRGRQEHHQVHIEHPKFVSNPVSGVMEYVEWIEGPTKTRQGGSLKGKGEFHNDFLQQETAVQ